MVRDAMPSRAALRPLSISDHFLDPSARASARSAGSSPMARRRVLGLRVDHDESSVGGGPGDQARATRSSGPLGGRAQLPPADELELVAPARLSRMCRSRPPCSATTPTTGQEHRVQGAAVDFATGTTDANGHAEPALPGAGDRHGPGAGGSGRHSHHDLRRLRQGQARPLPVGVRPHHPRQPARRPHHDHRGRRLDRRRGRRRHGSTSARAATTPSTAAAATTGSIAQAPATTTTRSRSPARR